MLRRPHRILRQAATGGPTGPGLRGNWVERMHAGRAQQTAQFTSMDGWQRGEDPRFDAFVADRRAAADFDAFDQRVERAYQVASKAHTQELWNACKRRLKDTGAKFTTDDTRNVQRAIGERDAWLRDVFAQIDADYRSGDPARERKAAAEITRALAGDPGDAIAATYEAKRAARFAGPLQRASADAAAGAGVEDPSGETPSAAHAATADGAPIVSEDEATRYAALRMNMAAVEAAVKGQFGRAGSDHWALLQRLKDEEYTEKLDAAAAKFAELQAQQDRHNATQATQGIRQTIERTHRAQVRFAAAMALEEEREKLLAAHAEMAQERAEEARARRAADTAAAAKAKAAGETPSAVAAALREERLARLVREHSDSVRQERASVQRKKEDYLRLVAQLEERAERREGDALLARGDGAGADVAAFGGGGGDGDILARSEALAAGRAADRAAVAAARSGDRSPASAAAAESASLAERKRAVWEQLHADKWEDPFQTIHQARIDARQTHSDVYFGSNPTKLGLLHNWHRGDGFDIAGGGQEAQMLQSPDQVLRPFLWGMDPNDVFNLDEDGNTEYIIGRNTGTRHVMDKATMDVDLSRERRRRTGGGASFTGPRFYKLGADDHGGTLRPVVPKAPPRK